MSSSDRDRKEILMKLQKAKSLSSDWHSNIRHWRDLYNFNHYKTKPKPGETQFQDPIYTNTVDLAVGIFEANRVVWNVVGWTPSKQEEKKTSAVEKFLTGIVDINDERNEYNILFEVYQHFIRDGCAVLFSYWDTDIALEAKTTVEVIDENTLQVVEMPAYSEPPIVVKVIDPLNIHVIPGGKKGRWACVFREEDLTVYEVEQEYNIRFEKYKGLDDFYKMQTKDRFVDYWDIGRTYILGDDGNVTGTRVVVRNAALFADEFIKPLSEMPGYDSLPYRIGFFKPIFRDNPAGWVSILQPMETAVEQLEKAINRRQRQIDVYSSLPMIQKTAAGRTPVTLEPGLGKIIPINQDEELGFPVWQGNPPDVERQIEFLRHRSQQAGFSDVMYGEGFSSASGYAISQLGDFGRIRLYPPIAHLEKMWTSWAKQAISLAVNFSYNTLISIYGQLKGIPFADKVSGADLDGFKVTCHIEPEFPNERIRKHAMATQIKGILSDRTIMELYLGIQQPDDERKKKLVELAQNNPIVMQYAILNEMKILADSGDAAAKMALEMMQKQLQGAGQGEAERRPEQPLGLQSSAGQPTPQELGNPTPGQTETEEMTRMASAAPPLIGGM